MQENEIEYVNLDNLGQGAARELFQACLDEVIENILDPNTSDTARREIVLKVAIKPDANRNMGGVEISCSSKLAQPKGYETQMFFGKKNGRLLASEYNPAQMKMFESDNLREITRKEAAAE